MKLRFNTIFLSIITFISSNIYARSSSLEIKLKNGSQFQDFVIQYNYTKHAHSGWKTIIYDFFAGETIANDKYVCYVINLSKRRPDIYFRAINTTSHLVTDVHRLFLLDESTVFIEFEFEDGPAGTTIINDGSRLMGSLPYVNVKFHTKSYQDSSIVTKLLTPARYFKSLVRRIVFSWSLSHNDMNNNISTYLVIYSSENEELCRIDVSNLSEYTWTPANDTFPNGRYFWQILVETSNNVFWGSEIRDFYFVDESGEKDSDDDGYNDNDEIIHGSDPLDKDDVPLIIMSPDNCPNGYINQQYFYILHTNFKSPVSWYLLEELPPGLTLRENGIIVGIPQETGDFSFLLQVEDESGKEDVKTMRIIIDSTSSSVRAGCGEYK